MLYFKSVYSFLHAYLIVESEEKSTLDSPFSWTSNLNVCMCVHVSDRVGGTTELYIYTVHRSWLLTVNPSSSVCPVELRCHSARWLSGPYVSLSSSITTLLKNELNFSFDLVSG